jgi:hypothetical protein
VSQRLSFRAVAQIRNHPIFWRNIRSDLGMPNPHATSTCLDGCDLSWTAGMPVYPEPTRGVGPKNLTRKDLREMVVLAAVCVISTIVFVPPLAGVSGSTPRRSELVARDLQVGTPLAYAPTPRAIPVSLVATSAQASPTKGASIVSRREPSRVSDRRLAVKLGRALAGDGRFRVQPFPRPSEF